MAMSPDEKARRKQRMNVRDAAFELYDALIILARDYDEIPESLDGVEVIHFVTQLEGIFNAQGEEEPAQV